MCEKQLQKIEVDWKIAKTSIYFKVIVIYQKKKKKVFILILYGNKYNSQRDICL